MEKAVLFPGQGSQRVGMGRELAGEFESARRVFEEANEALAFSVSEICFEGPEEKLVQTEFTQPAILTNSIAVLRTLEQEKGLSFDIAAGHSLGEWSALVAVGALGLADAVRLVNLRGRAMQQAVAAGRGAMAALIGLDLKGVEELCAEVAEGAVIAPANLNGGGQVVISGDAAAIDRAVAAAKGKGARRAVKLAVSAPFHCPLMQPAAEALAEALESIEIGPMSAPVVANVDAEPNDDPDRVKRLLVDQVTAPVRWEQSGRKLVELGVTRGYELGSGSVLRGLMRRVAKEINITTIGEPHEVTGWEA